jgi:hypothetical protein
VKTFRLARLAMEAEALRWRCFGARLLTRVCLAIVALVFAAGALVFAHVAGWIWLTEWSGRSPLAAAGILAAVDLVLAGLFAILAARSSPSRGERDALELRREAVRGMTSTYQSALLLGTIIRWLSTMRRRRDV